jgi:hypothetical protein
VTATASLIHRCPKCGVYFNPPREAASQCPDCGVWFHKWGTEPARSVEMDGSPMDEEPGAASDSTTYYGRVATLVFVAVWGLQLASLDYRGEALAGSFMHNIVLPIHEAGHVFFRPLGEFMTILGGSLFQVAFPLAIGIAFLVKQRDPFGAAVCVWWAGASLVDLSPYVWDALDPQLVLLGGRTGADGPHDWIYILQRLGAIAHAHGWGTATHHLGVATMIAGVAWGAWALRKARIRSRPGPPLE